MATDFQLIAHVRKIDAKLYGLRLFRREGTRPDVWIGHMIFRDDEWAKLVPGLREVDVLIEYLE